MRIANLLLLLALGGLSFVAWACEEQPARQRPSPPGASTPSPTAEPGVTAPPQSPAVRPAPEERAHEDTRPAPATASVRPAVRPSGPMDTEAVALPRADQRIAIFHSSNLEGEIDPCG